MNIGKLNGRITIEYKSTTQDAAYGTEVVTWTTLVDRAACNVQDVLPSKSESVANGIRMATQPTRIRCRYRSDVTSDMRVTLHRGTDQVCQIIAGPVELGHREGLEFMVAKYSTT